MFNPGTDRSEDVSHAVAQEILRRLDLKGDDVPSELEEFIDRHARVDRQPTLRLAVASAGQLIDFNYSGPSLVHSNSIGEATGTSDLKGLAAFGLHLIPDQRYDARAVEPCLMMSSLNAWRVSGSVILSTVDALA
jgi:hypothetical protein